MGIAFKKNERIKTVMFQFRSSLFPGGVPPPVILGDYRTDPSFFFGLHYPRQQMYEVASAQSSWPVRGQDSPRNYIMEFNVRGLEVSHQRNKDGSPCIDGTPNYDHQLRQWMMSKVGCAPPYWVAKSNMSLCTSRYQMKQIAELLRLAFANEIETEYDVGDPPCRRMERIQYDMQDIDLQTPENFDPDPPIEIRLSYQECTYKEIKSVQSMDLQALIGKNKRCGVYAIAAAGTTYKLLNCYLLSSMQLFSSTYICATFYL